MNNETLTEYGSSPQKIANAVAATSNEITMLSNTLNKQFKSGEPIDVTARFLKQKTATLNRLVLQMEKLSKSNQFEW